MTIKQDILKIETDGKIFLNTYKVKEELSLLFPTKILRNINNESLEQKPNSSANKYKLTIQTNQIFTVIPTIRLREAKNTSSMIKKLSSSIENDDDSITFRPIFEMYITNYTITNNDSYKWHITFEEV